MLGARLLCFSFMLYVGKGGGVLCVFPICPSRCLMIKANRYGKCALCPVLCVFAWVPSFYPQNNPMREVLPVYPFSRQRPGLQKVKWQQVIGGSWIGLQLPHQLSGKTSTYQCRRCRFNPWVRKMGNPLQYSCLENPWTEEPGGLQSIGSQKSLT